jgi:hypothetical protein
MQMQFDQNFCTVKNNHTIKIQNHSEKKLITVALACYTTLYLIMAMIKLLFIAFALK